MLKIVGKYLKRSREKSGVSVDKICSGMALDTGIYFRLEHGDLFLEGDKAIKKLAQILSCQTGDIADFISEEKQLWPE